MTEGGFRAVDIDDVWPSYAVRIERSRSEAFHLGWIRDACHNGAAICMAHADGIVVLTVGGTEAFKRLKVLMAAGKAGSFKAHEEDLADAAREVGASELSFRTDRPRAWQRLLGPHWQSDGERFWRAV